MKFRLTTKMNTTASAARRGVAAIGVSLGLCALAVSSGWAQSPTGTSPNVPTPYSWPVFHAGGANSTQVITTPPTANAPYFQMMGTPTGIFTIPSTGFGLPSGSVVSTQIPSYLLGNYVEAKPPTGITGIDSTIPGNPFGLVGNTPNNFFDQYLNDGTGVFDPTKPTSSYEIVSPYGYQQAEGLAITADETTTGFTNTGFAAGGNITIQANSDNSNYLLALPSSGGGKSVSWPIAITNAGLYQVSVSIPGVPAGITLITDAHYSISYTDTTGTPQTIPLVIVSQGTSTATHTINIGPQISVQAASTITVQLTNQSASTIASDIVIADEVLATPISNAIQVDESNVGVTNTGFTVGTDAGTIASSVNSTYLTSAPAPAGGNSVSWPITAPYAGSYQVSAHIPVVPAGATFVTDAHYTIAYTDINGTAQTITLTGVNQSPGTIAKAVDIGPVITVSGGTVVTVTLTNQSAATAPAVIIADSIILSPTSAASLTIDDDNTFNTTPNLFTPGTWTQGQPDTSATNSTYTRTLATSTTPTTQVAWTFHVQQAGTYNLTMHIPDSQIGTITEYRIPDAHYTIAVSNPGTTQNVLVSQRDDNAQQFIAGPVRANANATITVTLTNLSNNIDPTHTTDTYVVADSMTLTQQSSAIINGSPAAINVTEYPEIATVNYFGVQGNTTNLPDATLHGITPTPLSTTPYDNITYTNTDPTAVPTVSGTATVDKYHSIRQLVYFGRLELTSSGQIGYVYCVDGFTGGVVWRYQTRPIQTASVNQSDTSPFTTPAIARIIVNTAVGNAAPNYQIRLVLVVGDNTGKLYCLDALGNRDGTGIAPTQAGTTNAYWIYRPDPTQPKTVNAAGDGVVKTADANSDLPTPAAFETASPIIVVNPAIARTAAGPGNALVYIGDSHGTMYAFDASGVSPNAGTNSNGLDPYNVPLSFGVAALNLVNTPKPLWWFMTRSPGANNASNSDIESAPSAVITNAATGHHIIYFGTAHEVEDTSNVGRLYAIDSDASGTSGPVTVTGGTLAPGSLNYNVLAHAKWTFPDLYGTGNSTDQSVRPALGNITSSPVVFTIPGTTAPRVYVAANVGLEIPFNGTTQDPRPDDTETGRLWAVDANTGAKVWSYPQANDPNDASKDTAAEPANPIGAFLHATPAMGVVEFPASIQYFSGAAVLPATDYTHADVNGDVKGKQVPMLYVGTAGVNDTAFYAIDVNGSNNPLTPLLDDMQALIYRLESPSGEIFQSSPALVTNANNTATPGNGGAVYATLGNSLYQFQATPTSNTLGSNATLGTAAQPFPFVGVDAQFEGFGPISSPAIAAATINDVTSTGVQDWVYVCDNTTGFLHGITPGQKGGTTIDLGGIVPTPPQGIEPPLVPVNKSVTLHTHIFDGNAPHIETSTDMTKENPIGAGQTVPVFEWGQNVYIRISNVVPPNPGDVDSRFRIPDPDNSAYYYSNGSAITFQLTDTDPQGNSTGSPDSGVIPGVLLFTPAAAPAALPTPTATSTTLPGNGFVERFDTPLLASGETLNTGRTVRRIISRLLEHIRMRFGMDPID